MIVICVVILDFLLSLCLVHSSISRRLFVIQKVMMKHLAVCACEDADNDRGREDTVTQNERDRQQKMVVVVVERFERVPESGNRQLFIIG